jgi:hypothetical protein
MLRKQGFSVVRESIRLPDCAKKEDYRRINSIAVAKTQSVAARHLEPLEDQLIDFIANGDEVCPDAISPKLVLVKPDTLYALLFRYACLHWSIPVSAGYGRRLRFLVFDEHNSKLIGLFGLGDPVFSLKARDQWIGWNRETKRDRLYHIMDAYVLGAVPPYSHLICGKLIAMLTLTNEVRTAFREKYCRRISLIRKIEHRPYLALVTTTSALGRSSIYNRIRINGFSYWKSLGFTKGSGEFHFSNGVYEKIFEFAENNCQPTAKHPAWGSGFRNKREVIKKCLASVGLPTDLLYHGICREIFAAPLGRNTLRFLRGETSRPCFYDWSAKYLSDEFIRRWLISRAERNMDYQHYNRDDFRLWPNGHK